MPIYASPEQFMRDRSDYARKGIARGRSVVVTIFSGGVLFVAENPSPTLHKVSEIYDRIGFAATGRYNEYENLRTAGIRLADVRGFSYDRRDVNSRWLANAYAQTLGSVFSENSKPLEVELCVAEVGWPDGPSDGSADQLYRISYDGSLFDEPRFVVMGGATEPIIAALDASFTDGWDLATALRACIGALGTGPDGNPRELPAENIEVAVLDRRLLSRTFRRVEGQDLAALLSNGEAPDPTDGPAAGQGGGPAVSETEREPNIATAPPAPEQLGSAQDPPIDPEQPDQRGEEKAGDEPAGTGE